MVPRCLYARRLFRVRCEINVLSMALITACYLALDTPAGTWAYAIVIAAILYGAASLFVSCLVLMILLSAQVYEPEPGDKEPVMNKTAPRFAGLSV